MKYRHIHFDVGFFVHITSNHLKVMNIRKYKLNQSSSSNIKLVLPKCFCVAYLKGGCMSFKLKRNIMKFSIILVVDKYKYKYLDTT